jgi:hypothetical protein
MGTEEIRDVEQASVLVKDVLTLFDLVEASERTRHAMILVLEVAEERLKEASRLLDEYQQDHYSVGKKRAKDRKAVAK